MRQRLLEGCLNPYKHHLWRLPDIPENKQTPQYPGESRRALVIFPIFQTNPGDHSIEHHIARSACWARRSWLLFSDAVQRDVQIGFYVGDTVLDRVDPILKANGIDTDRDVFLLDEARFEGNPATHLGKKLSCFNDSQFAEYDWILQFDADMFLGSPQQKKCQFFSFFDTAPRIPAAVRVNARGSKPPHHTIEHYHWWHVLLHSTDDKEKIEEWLKRAKELVPAYIVDKYTSEDHHVTTCHGGIYAFPIKHYLKNKPEQCDWIARAGKLLQDDEAVFSLWHMSNNPLFCLSTETQMPFCTEVSIIYEQRAKANPCYFSHFATFHQEWIWREDIDSL